MSRMPDNISLIRASTNTSDYDKGLVGENTLLDSANLFYPYLVDNGGNTNIVSLTIDVINQDDLQYTNETVGGDWSTNERKRRNITNLDAIWGFKETHHSSKASRALSNAFCMAGQRLTFYIGTKGHSVGYIDNQWVYGHTSVVVTSLDLVDGSQDTLFTFDGFEDAEDDSGRYFTWIVPWRDLNMFGQYGLFGLNVIKLEVTTTYYEDAEKTTPLSGSYPNRHQSLLQLLIYHGAQEFIDVDAGDADIKVSTPWEYDELHHIFSKTLFASFESANQNTLTISQKRAMMADQAAVLFMSQHPVANANAYPSKIIGFGAESAMAFTKDVVKTDVYGERYDVVVDMVIDRLFGMLASYKAFNYVADFEEYFTDFTQSTQLLRDPLKSYVVDNNGVLSSDYGVSGSVFNPYIFELQNAEFMDSIPAETIMDVALFDGNIDIGNIAIISPSGNDLSDGDSQVKVSFDVIYGESNIKQIEYQLFTISRPSFYKRKDANGTSRANTFNLSSSFYISLYETVYAKIIVEDFEGNVHVFSATEFVHLASDVKPVIYGLTVYQSKYGSDFVNINYVYDGHGEINNASVSVDFSFNNGTTWSSLSSTLYGDYGYNIMPGHRHISWDISSDLALVSVGADVSVRLTLKDVDDVTAIGQITSSRLTWSLEKPVVALKLLYEDELREELEHSSSSSSTSSMSSESIGNISSSSSSSSEGITSSSSSSSSSSSLSSYDLEDCYDFQSFLPSGMNGSYNRTGTYFNELPVYSNGTYDMFWAYYVSGFTWGISQVVGVHIFDDSATGTVGHQYPSAGGSQWLFVGPSGTGGYVYDGC